ncbi:hypothetical protein B0J18DRAFT_364269 [Chaetomium sp. MPI-SDFR-AT-0129]|nr:hypothetical protein B0J18DRAFT_364269 [Chaetomium sp. MPI-SDFR-AT-0129]
MGDNSTKPQGRFTLKDASVENLRPFRVIVVGAGFSGILAAIRIPERLRNVELVVYDKNEGVGGVWWSNRYPGVACDIPSHSYQYSFAPNPNWSNLYAPGSEIQQYLQDVAERFGATRFIKTRHQVECCEWDESEKKWRVKVTNLATGETLEAVSNVLIMARGQFSDMSWPSIPGLDKFQGAVMHSGDWDTNYDFRNKRIGIIGNGSSAIQIIPQLQQVEGAKLTCFMRSPTWISPAFGDGGMIELGLDPADTNFSPEQRHKLATDPSALLKLRKVFETAGNTIHESTLRGTPMQQEHQAVFHQTMLAKLETRPDLAALLIPSFAPGCRRLTPGRGFLEALLEPNVVVVGDEIVEVTAGGFTSPVCNLNLDPILSPPPPTTNPPITLTTTHPLDILLCATGYSPSTSPPFPIHGRSHLPLTTHWHPRPQTYLSLATNCFPNLLFLFGPNSAIGTGSLTQILEAEVDYATAFIRKLQREDYVAAEPRGERVRDFGEVVDGYFEGTVYMDQGCHSWYKRGGKVVGLWPGSTLHALEVLRAPRWEDWVFEGVGEDDGDGRGKKKRENRLRWLGNGWSETQRGGGDPSWYINPDQVEVPVEGRPEENVRFRARPWCY